MSSPRIDAGWLARDVLQRGCCAIASTNPSPSTLTEAAERHDVGARRNAVSSWSDGGIARSWMRDPPGCSKNVAPSKKPARFSVIWLEPPRIGVRWHSPQPVALKIGPSAVRDGFGTGEFFCSCCRNCIRRPGSSVSCPNPPTEPVLHKTLRRSRWTRRRTLLALRSARATTFATRFSSRRPSSRRAPHLPTRALEW